MAATRIYQEFEPATRWTSEPDAEILVVDLPGFKREQVKLAVTTTRKLRLTGERPTGGNKWIRFRHEIPVPMTVDIDSVSAMFKDNKLYIRHSKIKTESLQTKPPSQVVKKPHDQHEAEQGLGSKAATVEKPDGAKTKTENPQAKPLSPVNPPVSKKPHDQHETKQGLDSKATTIQNDNKALIGEPKGPLSSKDEEKEKVGAKLFEKYKEATGNVVKEAKSKRQLLFNLAASITLVLLILLYARNAVRSSLVWISEE